MNQEISMDDILKFIGQLYLELKIAHSRIIELEEKMKEPKGDK